MKLRFASILTIASAGTGCAIGIPIGSSTAPEKFKPLTWSEIVDTWENSWEKIANRAYNKESLKLLHEENETKRIKEVEEHYKKLEIAEQNEERQDEITRKISESLRRAGTLEFLKTKKQAREQRRQARREEKTKLIKRIPWEEKREEIDKQFNKKMEDLKNLSSYCSDICSEDLIKKINEAKNRAAERLEWMRAE